MKAIYNVAMDAGYGDLFGSFVAEREVMDFMLNEKIEVYFGEVCGKHSEVQGYVDAREVTLVSEDPEDVAWFERLNLTHGYNPLHQRVLRETLSRFNLDPEENYDLEAGEFITTILITKNQKPEL